MLSSLLDLHLCLSTTQQTFFALSLPFFLYLLLHFWLIPGGFAWRNYHDTLLKGPSGWPLLGTLPYMGSLAHQHLATIASYLGCTRLMALSVGTTRVIITSHPETAREILTSPSFSDRPVKVSARFLMFERAIGFAPHGAYWRHLRRISANYMFSPRRISTLEGVRQWLVNHMLENVEKEMDRKGEVKLRGILQSVSLKNMLESVFGSDFEGVFNDDDDDLGFMVREGYELISEFNLEDHFPLTFLDFNGVKRRCCKLTCRVNEVLGRIIKVREKDVDFNKRNDFLSVLLSLPIEEQLSHSDMVAVLWEILSAYQDALHEILEVIKSTCSTHGLPQAQTWVPCIQQGKEGCQHSDENLSRCVSTVDSACFISNPSMKDFHEACSEHHLFKGQGVAGRAFLTNQPCFSSDVTTYSKTEYPLSHHARMFGLCGAVAIRLRCIYTGKANFVVEFFLPSKCRDFEEQRKMLTSLSILIQRVCTSLRVAIDEELEQETSMLGKAFLCFHSKTIV